MANPTQVSTSQSNQNQSNQNQSNQNQSNQNQSNQLAQTLIQGANPKKRWELDIFDTLDEEIRGGKKKLTLPDRVSLYWSTSLLNLALKKNKTKKWSFSELAILVQGKATPGLAGTIYKKGLEFLGNPYPQELVDSWSAEYAKISAGRTKRKYILTVASQLCTLASMLTNAIISAFQIPGEHMKESKPLWEATLGWLNIVVGVASIILDAAIRYKNKEHTVLSSQTTSLCKETNNLAQSINQLERRIEKMTAYTGGVPGAASSAVSLVNATVYSSNWFNILDASLNAISDTLPPFLTSWGATEAQADYLKNIQMTFKKFQKYLTDQQTYMDNVAEIEMKAKVAEIEMKAKKEKIGESINNSASDLEMQNISTDKLGN